MSFLKKARDAVLDILFPPLCLACRTYLENEHSKDLLLCDSCFRSIHIYSTVFQPDPRFALLAVAPYEERAIRELIHRFKYDGFLKAEVPLGKITTVYLDAISARTFIPKDSVVLPVPLHRTRLRERGFNQAEHIAEIVGRELGLPLERNVLIKTRPTRRQADLQKEKERRTNVRGSFAVENPLRIKGKNVILVDDVYTSGSTAKEAIKMLLRAGAEEISIFVVAKAN